MNDLFKHVRDHLVWDHDLEDVDSEINDIVGAANDAEVLHTLNLYAPQIPGHEVGTPEHSVMWLHQYEHSDDPFTGSGEVQNHVHEDDPRYPRGHGSWKTAGAESHCTLCGHRQTPDPQDLDSYDCEECGGTATIEHPWSPNFEFGDPRKDENPWCQLCGLGPMDHPETVIKKAEIIPFPPGSEGEDDGNPFAPFSMSEWQMVKGPKRRKSGQAQDDIASETDETQSEWENTKPVQDVLDEQSPKSVPPWAVYTHLVVEHDYPVLDEEPHLFGDPRHEGTPGMEHWSPSFHHSIHSAVHLLGSPSKHHHRQREPEGDRDEFGFPRKQ